MREAVTQTPPAGFLAPGSSPSPAAFPSPAGDSGSLAGGSPVTVALPQRIHTAFPLGPSRRNGTRGALPFINTAILRARPAAVNTIIIPAHAGTPERPPRHTIPGTPFMKTRLRRPARTRVSGLMLDRGPLDRFELHHVAAMLLAKGYARLLPET